MAGGLWALHRFVGFPEWLAWIGGFFGLLGPVMDAINIVHIRGALRKLDAGRDEHGHGDES